LWLGSTVGGKKKDKKLGFQVLREGVIKVAVKGREIHAKPANVKNDLMVGGRSDKVRDIILTRDDWAGKGAGEMEGQ